MYSTITYILAVMAMFATLSEATNYAVSSAMLIGVSSKDTEGKKLKALSGGDIIVAGISTGSLGSSTNAGGYDFVIQRYDSTKTLVWTAMFGGSQDDILYDMVIDASDNIYVVGTCSGSVDGHSSSSGSIDICLVKFDSSGSKLWSIINGGTSTDTPRGLCVDAAGTYIYIVGDSTSSVFNGLSRTGTQSSFWTKFKTVDGTFQAATWVCNYASNTANSCAIDSSGYVVVVGSTSSSGTGTTCGTVVGGTDNLFAKYQTSGVTVWKNVRTGTSGTDTMSSVVVDSSNNIYTCGYTVSNSQKDIYVQKLSTTAGAVQWSQTITGDSGANNDEEAFDCKVDSTSTLLFVTGYTKSSSFYGNTQASTSSVGSTIIATLFAANGSVSTTNVLNSASSDTGNSVLLHSGGSLYIAGQSYGAYGSTATIGSPDMSFLTFGVAAAAVSAYPSAAPSLSPSAGPTAMPSVSPSAAPTIAPTFAPSALPTEAPTAVPTFTVTNPPTQPPTFAPTVVPSLAPTQIPTAIPSIAPTFAPSALPTEAPTAVPTFTVTNPPTQLPTFAPTVVPSAAPTQIPTAIPSIAPTFAPSALPTEAPTPVPTFTVTNPPTQLPTFAPTAGPTHVPTLSPTSIAGHSNKSGDTAMVAGIVIGSVVFVCLLLFVFWYCCNGSSRKKAKVAATYSDQNNIV